MRREGIGEFIVYEADNILCDVSEMAEKRPAVCCAATLVPSKKSIRLLPCMFLPSLSSLLLLVDGLTKMKRIK